MSSMHKIMPCFIWALGAAFFFSEYFARVAPGVMVPELMHTYHVTAFTLGTLSFYFYCSYLAMQIPVGILIDRFGVRKLLALSSLICFLGCVLFAMSSNLNVAILSRLLTGFGAAFAFVSALKLATDWLPEKWFGMFAGITQALGMLGASVGEAPVALCVEYMGWRNTMLVMSLVFLLLALLIIIFVKDKPQKNLVVNTNSFDLVKNLKKVLFSSRAWINAGYVGLLYAPTAAFAEFWGVSFLVRCYGMTHAEAAFAIGLIFIGWGIGGPLAGWVSDLMGLRRPVMFASSLMCFLLISAVIYMPHTSNYVIYVVLFLYGVCNTGVVISYAIANEMFRGNAVATSMAFANIASVIVGAVLQPLIGKGLDMLWDGQIVNQMRWYSAANYRAVFFVLPICSLLSLVLVKFVRETYCGAVRLERGSVIPRAVEESGDLA